ncbi:MAG: WD40 repeat domain-containing protein [candidate division WS1 bacterium]|mgnify:FL=1|nr:WD40 repeat domain-containing protein [candidate division WS1 bacterium]
MNPWIPMACITLLMSIAVGLAQPAVDSLGDPLPEDAIQRLGTLKMRYGGIGGLTYLPDGRGVVLYGGNVHLWDLAEGRLESDNPVSSRSLAAVELRQDGKALLLADGSGTVYEWDPESREVIRSWETEQRGLVSVCYSLDSKRFLVAGNSPLGYMEYDMETGARTAAGQTEFAATRNGAIYGPDDSTVIMGGGYNHLLEHRVLATGELLGKFATNYQAKQICLSGDRNTILVGVESCAEEYNLSDYSRLHRYDPVPGEAGRCYALDFADMRNEAVLGLRTGSVHRYDRVTGEEVLRWMAHSAWISAVAVSPDEKYVLTFGGGLLVESDMDTGLPRMQWARHGGPIRAVAFTSTGDRVISGSEDATMRVWDPRTGESLLRIEGAVFGAYALAVSPDDSRVAAGCKDGVIREYSLADGTLLRELSGHLGIIRSLAYTHDGRRLVSSADDGTVRIWSDDSAEAAAKLQGHLGGVLSVALSADDQLLLTGGRDGTVRLWDLTEARQLKMHGRHRGWIEAVAFAGDDNWAVSTGRDGKVMRWDLQNEDVVADINNGEWTYTMSVAPDGNKVYCGAGSGFNCWDLRDGHQVSQVRGHTAGVLSLALSPDGRAVVTGSSDTSLLVWEAPAPE